MYNQAGEAPSLADLSDDFGVGARAIQRYLDELAQAKILRIRRRPGAPSLYFLYDPDSPRQKAGKRRTPDHTITPDRMITPDHTITPDRTITPDQTIVGIPAHQEAPNSPTHDHTIMGTPHVVVDDPILDQIDHDHEESSSTVQPTQKTKQLTPLAAWLFEQGVGAALEFADLDFEAATADFLRRRGKGHAISLIVRAWRMSPPAPLAESDYDDDAGDELASAGDDQADEPAPLEAAAGAEPANAGDDQADEQARDLWRQVCAALAVSIPIDQLNRWIFTASIVRIAGGVVVIRVGSEMHRQMIYSYSAPIRRVLLALLGYPVSLDIEIAGERGAA